MNIKTIGAEVSIDSGINGAVSISNDLVEADTQIGREVIKTVYEEPVLESLEVVANGTYEPEEGVDGYSDVTVNVPDRIPVLESLDVIANGSYFPEEGVDGFNEVLVNVPTDPEKMVASGNFTPTSSGQTKTIDTGRTDWTHMLIVPHVFPYVGLTASGLVRAIMSKHVDLENNVMITAYASSSGSSYTSSSYRLVQEGGECEVSDGVVKFSGEGASVGKWIKGCQYDWWAWTDTPVEPEEQNVFEGEFEATETGVLTIDLPYEGDDFPKMIIIHPISGIMSHSDEFLEHTPLYAINLIIAMKSNDTEPSYTGADGGSSNQMRINVAYHYTGLKYSSISPITSYVFSSESNEGLYGANSSIRMPNNKTMKLFASSVRRGSITFLAANIKYKYQVFY